MDVSSDRTLTVFMLMLMLNSDRHMDISGLQAVRDVNRCNINVHTMLSLCVKR